MNNVLYMKNKNFKAIKGNNYRNVIAILPQKTKSKSNVKNKEETSHG